MNRIAQLTISLAALFSAMSCVEKINSDLSTTPDHITVTSEVSPHTKAGYEGTSVLPGTFTMTIRQGTATSPDYTMTKSASSNSYSFPQGSVPTWETSDVNQISIKAMTTPSGYNMATGVMTIPTDQSSAANVQASDLLGAKSGAGITISGNNINVAFNHLMTKMQVTYSSSVEITRIDLANVAVKGTYSYTDMKHKYPDNTSYIGTVERMYKSGNSAEAIFFPFDPRELNVTPKLRIYVSGKNTPIECDITLREGTRFVPGKVYMVKVAVTGTSADADVTVESWGANGGTMQIPGERVLWIGTSIPAASGYPEMVADALNCTVVNNAVGGSRVLGVPTDVAELFGDPFSWLTQRDFNTYPEHGWNHLFAGGLSQTREEADSRYRAQLMKISNNDKTWVDKEISAIQSLSYEELIIPFINGEKDYCTTVIIDHGFNDIYGVAPGFHGLVWEAGGHINYGGVPDHIYGSNYLVAIRDKKITYEQYKTELETNFKDLLYAESSYLLAMSKIIMAIRSVNPNIRIIIGNYFMFDCPYVNNFIYPGQHYTGVICYFNEAVAGMWDLDIVNVYKYLWISESDYWAGVDSNNKVIYDPTKFCPDGVHPNNSEAGRAIADIYIRQLDGIIGSRVN